MPTSRDRRHRRRNISANEVTRDLLGNSGQHSDNRPGGGVISFYSGESSIRRQPPQHTWRPGQVITPPTIPDNHFSSSDGQGLLPDESNSQQLENSGSRAVNISDMMRLFQSSMEKEFQKVSSKLDGVIERIDSLEKSQTTLEEQMQSYQSMHANTSGSTPKTPSSRKRKRLTPVDLQDKIRKVHSSFDEENQIKVSEPINSPHNSHVTATIVNAIGTDKYDEDIIHKGCKTYRKTLVARSKHMSTPVKKKKCIRSRKQRIYERRSKVLKSGREKELWQDVTPDMMSDEEQIGENYVRHQPSYRSDALNKFITKLDNRGDKKMSAHPRTKRTMGSPRKLCPPSHARKWTVKNERIHSATEQDGSEDTSTTTMATINEDAITPPQSMASEAELDSIEDSDSEFSVNNDDEAIESSDTD